MKDFLQSDVSMIRVGAVTIHGARHIYADVSAGEPRASLGSSRLLEIAVSGGRASDLLGGIPGSIIGMEVTVT